jgi:hypothetical protein
MFSTLRDRPAELGLAVAEFIVQNTNEGLAVARVGGRPTVVNPDLLRQARDLLPNAANSPESIASCSASRSAPSTTTSRT